MPLWRNNTWNNAVLSSLFLFLSSKPSRKHLDTTLLTTYISTRAAYICIIFAREKKSIGATEISAAGAVWWIHCSEQGQGTLGINRGEMSVPPPSPAAPAAPAASTLHPRVTQGLGQRRATTSHYTGRNRELLLASCFVFEIRAPTSSPLYIQIKISEYLPLKLKDTDGCFELKEKAKDTGFSYKVP